MAITCHACHKQIDGKGFRFGDVPESAFCSIDCQISMTQPIVHEMVINEITEALPELPTFTGQIAVKLFDDRGCVCGVFYENQITVPKRHSVVCYCPRCGCVTVD